MGKSLADLKRQFIFRALKPNELFTYRKRGIEFAIKEISRSNEKLGLFLYEDVILRGEEHSNLIKMQVKHEKHHVVIDESRLGKVSILTNLDRRGEKVYGLYKAKEEIEQAFDAMKNEFENDKCYLGDDTRKRLLFRFVSLAFPVLPCA